jgi:hypothetical protein
MSMTAAVVIATVRVMATVITMTVMVAGMVMATGTVITTMMTEVEAGPDRLRTPPPHGGVSFGGFLKGNVVNPIPTLQNPSVSWSMR